MVRVTADPFVPAVASSHANDAGSAERAVRARLGAVTAGRCDSLVIRRHASTLSVTVRRGSRRLDVAADLRDPDVEWHLAAKVANFVERDDVSLDAPVA